MKKGNFNLRNKKIILFAVIFILAILCISPVKAQIFGLPQLPYPYGFSYFNPFTAPFLPTAPSLFPFYPAIDIFRTAAIPLTSPSFTPVTVVVPQVTAAGLTITSLVPSLQPAPAPTVTIILNLTAGLVLPTTFIAPFPLTAPIVGTLPVIATTVNIPAATPSLTTLIALGLGGGVPGIGGGSTLLNLLPLPVPTTTLPTVQVLPTAITPTAIPVI